TEDNEGLEVFFRLINLYFTRPKFTVEGFKAVVNRTELNLNKKNVDHETKFEEYFKRFNTQSLPELLPLSAADLKNIDLVKSKQLNTEAFGNPREFVCVVVGSFDVEKIKPAILNYLASIPNTGKNFSIKTVKQNIFPNGISQTSVPQHRRTECLTRITFPLKVSLANNQISQLEIACQVIEYHFKKNFIDQMQTTHGFDVAYEFPLYPTLQQPWITLQFISEPELCQNLIKIVLEEFKQFQSKGPSEEEVKAAKAQQISSDDYWENDNSYWVMVLSNYYLWDFSPMNIINTKKNIENLNHKNIVEIIKTYFSLENYTIISSKT
ncbi:MAG: insulinase family protein, partial [Bacteroidetes bacterium]|nr:insulinase family protein [Bacteroidota bacterium]